jgi:hypothetical protein
MDTIQLLPLIAGGLFALFLAYAAFGKSEQTQYAWVLPAALSSLFLGISLQAILTEGPLGFWPEHTRNHWGNQIWCDLLLAASIGWVFVIPQAKALKMRLAFWLLLILATGSIGFLAMVSRMLYLRDKIGHQPATLASMR